MCTCVCESWQAAPDIRPGARPEIYTRNPCWISGNSLVQLASAHECAESERELRWFKLDFRERMNGKVLEFAVTSRSAELRHGVCVKIKRFRLYIVTFPASELYNWCSIKIQSSAYTKNKSFSTIHECHTKLVHSNKPEKSPKESTSKLTPHKSKHTSSFANKKERRLFYTKREIRIRVHQASREKLRSVKKKERKKKIEEPRAQKRATINPRKILYCIAAPKIYALDSERESVDSAQSIYEGKLTLSHSFALVGIYLASDTQAHSYIYIYIGGRRNK